MFQRPQERQRQQCFVKDGFMWCNYFYHRGKIVRPVEGKWLRFLLDPCRHTMEKQKRPNEFTDSIGSFENPA